MSRPRPVPSVAGMHHEPILSDLVRAHERDLRAAADQHRLARSVRPGRPAPGGSEPPRYDHGLFDPRYGRGYEPVPPRRFVPTPNPPTRIVPPPIA